MIPATQALAYARIRESGVLQRMQWRVFAWLAENGPATRNEIDLALGGGRPNANYSRRLADMERMGAIARGDARLCAVTGRPCETWAVTWQMPVKLLKRTSERAALVSVAKTVARLVRSPRARTFPDATLEQIRAVVEAAHVEAA